MFAQRRPQPSAMLAFDKYLPPPTSPCLFVGRLGCFHAAGSELVAACYQANVKIGTWARARGELKYNLEKWLFERCCVCDWWLTFYLPPGLHKYGTRFQVFFFSFFKGCGRFKLNTSAAWCFLWFFFVAKQNIFFSFVFHMDIHISGNYNSHYRKLSRPRGCGTICPRRWDQLSHISLVILFSFFTWRPYMTVWISVSSRVLVFWSQVLVSCSLKHALRSPD